MQEGTTAPAETGLVHISVEVVMSVNTTLPIAGAMAPGVEDTSVTVKVTFSLTLAEPVTDELRAVISLLDGPTVWLTDLETGLATKLASPP